MRYKDYFQNLILESLEPTPQATPSGTPRVHDDPTGGMESMLDQGTNPDDYLVKGIRQTFDEVQRHFNSKMTEFADTLSPETIGSTTFSALEENIGEVFDFTNRIQVYAKGKIDQIQQDPYAIMAAFLASEPTKQSAFEELHSNLDTFKEALTEIKTQLGSLKSQIDSFVKEVKKVDADQASQNIAAQQQPEPNTSPNQGGGLEDPNGGGGDLPL